MAGIKGQMQKRPTAGARARAWTSMRILGRFTIADIMATAEIPRQNASKYLVALEKAGFLVRVRDNVSGQAGSLIIYRLVRNAGPDAPIVQTNGDVLDPNTGTRYGQAGEEVGTTTRVGIIDRQPELLVFVLEVLATDPHIGPAALDRRMRERFAAAPGVQFPSLTALLRWMRDRRPGTGPQGVSR